MDKIDLQPQSSWILDDTNSLLFKKCNDVIFPLNEKDQLLVKKMVSYIDTCYNGLNEKYNITNGIAIAAPQVGCDKKIIYIHFKLDKEYKFLLANPKIIATSLGKCYLKDGEGCLSVKKKHNGHVARFNKVKVSAIDMNNENKKIEINAEALLAICLQHEIDHLDGIMFYQKINKKNKFLDKDKSLIAY